MASIQPLWGNVLLELDEKDEKTRGGIIIPEPARDVKQTGVVMAVGHGRSTEQGIIGLESKPGDHVIFGRHLGYKVYHQGKVYYMIQDRFIEGRYTQEDEMTTKVTMSMDPDKTYEYLAVDLLMSDDELAFICASDVMSPGYEKLLEHAKRGWIPFEWEEKDAVVRHVTRLVRELVVLQSAEATAEGDSLEDTEQATQVVADVPMQVAHGVTPQVTGAHEVMTLALSLYDAEKDDPKNPEWQRHRRYEAAGWIVDRKEELTGLTIIRGYKRPVNR